MATVKTLPATRPIWGVPASRAPVASDRYGEIVRASRTETKHAALKASFIVSMFCLLVLDRFGLKISDAYSVNPSLFAMYGMALIVLLSRMGQFGLRTTMLYIAIVTIVGVSFIVNVTLDMRQYASLGSMLLLLVLYAPLVLSIKRDADTDELWQWMMKWFLVFAMGSAVAGIVQFYVQFVFRAPWLFDFTPYLPAAIRGSGLYNTTNPVGSLIKSNGFFLREASGFSGYMAFALVCELSLRKRKLAMALFAFAMVVSYSGSGILALGVAMLFPLGQQTLVRVLAIAVVGAIVFLLFGDALNLTYTLGRVGEFQSTSSSAYCRFIAPGKLVAEQIDSDLWTTLIGHGPGTTQKISTVCETTYGKVVFEYGMLGAIAFLGFMLGIINRAAAPIRMRVVLIVNWLLLGGNLLAPESLLLVFLITGLWPEPLRPILPMKPVP